MRNWASDRQASPWTSRCGLFSSTARRNVSWLLWKPKATCWQTEPSLSPLTWSRTRIARALSPGLSLPPVGKAVPFTRVTVWINASNATGSRGFFSASSTNRSGSDPSRAAARLRSSAVFAFDRSSGASRLSLSSAWYCSADVAGLSLRSSCACVIEIPSTRRKPPHATWCMESSPRLKRPAAPRPGAAEHEAANDLTGLASSDTTRLSHPRPGSLKRLGQRRAADRSRVPARALRRPFSTARGCLAARGSSGIAPRREAAAQLASDPLPGPGRDLGVGDLPIARQRAQVTTQGRLDLGEAGKRQGFVHAPHLFDRVSLQVLEADLVEAAPGDQAHLLVYRIVHRPVIPDRSPLHINGGALEGEVRDQLLGGVPCRP